ncbi:MAG: hypothetical protein L0Y54_06660 [Sporichthyaceae bacterium]|nr:hypothetical protein [Sporichthyaceae bacterium]
MARAYILEFPGATAEQYDQVVEKMDLGGHAPAGAVFHWSAITDDGLLVVDVWESAAEFEKFRAAKIVPITTEFGLGTPKVREYDVHRVLD